MKAFSDAPGSAGNERVPITTPSNRTIKKSYASANFILLEKFHNLILNLKLELLLSL